MLMVLLYQLIHRISHTKITSQYRLEVMHNTERRSTEYKYYTFHSPSNWCRYCCEFISS